MKTISNHKDIKLMTKQEKYGKHAMKPNFKNGYEIRKQTST